MARKKRRTPKRARKPTGKAPATAPAPASRRDLRVASLLLAIAAFALYANTIPNDYALDDAIVITENRFTQAGISGIGDLLRHDGIIGFSGDVTGQVGRYRPLSLVTFAIEQELFGANAHVGHAVNALLYSLCVVLVYRLLAALLPGAPPRAWWRSAPFLAALLFAAHPVHTEVVANIKRARRPALADGRHGVRVARRALVSRAEPGEAGREHGDLLPGAALALYLKLLLVLHPLTFDYYPYHVPILCWSDWQPEFSWRSASCSRRRSERA